MTASAFDFDEEEFGAWFEDYKQRFLEPASDSATRLLDTLLREELSAQQINRIKVRPGRVKTRARTWKKLNERYSDRVTATDDIPGVMDDLVGVRIVCTNLADVDRVVDVIEDKLAAAAADQEPPPLGIFRDSIKDHRTDPRPSGYRAYHVNLCTGVALPTERHSVTLELQIRTLLQDSWGELTHEDIYKPGSPRPPLVISLSRHMADLMSVLDGIAEELSEQADVDEEVRLDEGAGDDPGVASSGIDTNAALSFLATRVANLDKPTPLASLAWDLQHEFGREVVDNWLGFGRFTDLLRAAAPAARIGSGAPSYVVPEGFDLDEYSGGSPNVPRAATVLHQADHSFPLIESSRWPAIYERLSYATSAVRWVDLDIRTINALTREGRDYVPSTSSDAAEVSRSNIKYVARALLFAKKLRSAMAAEEIQNAFSGWTMTRARELGSTDDDVQELEEWLHGG